MSGVTVPLLIAPPAMTASQMRIAETIDAFYGDAGTKDGVSRSYKQAVEDLDAETIKALDGPYRLDDLAPCSGPTITRIVLTRERRWVGQRYWSQYRGFVHTFPI